MKKKEIKESRIMFFCCCLLVRVGSADFAKLLWRNRSPNSCKTHHSGSIHQTVAKGMTHCLCKNYSFDSLMTDAMWKMKVERIFYHFYRRRWPASRQLWGWPVWQCVRLCAACLSMSSFCWLQALERKCLQLRVPKQKFPCDSLCTNGASLSSRSTRTQTRTK